MSRPEPLPLPTHQDDCAHHAEWQQLLHEFIRQPAPPRRVVHRGELPSWREGLDQCEVLWDGPALQLEPDLTLIHTPGHTAGSACLLYGQTLFTGDHINLRENNALAGSRDFCFHSWSEVLRSNRNLLNYDFTTVLPGHGAPAAFASVEEAHEALRRGFDL